MSNTRSNVTRIHKSYLGHLTQDPLYPMLREAVMQLPAEEQIAFLVKVFDTTRDRREQVSEERRLLEQFRYK